MELRVYIGVSKFFKRANLLTIFTGHPNFLIFNSCCLKGCLYRKLHDIQSCLVLCVDIMCVCINKKWVRVGYVFYGGYFIDHFYRSPKLFNFQLMFERLFVSKAP